MHYSMWEDNIEGICKGNVLMIVGLYCCWENDYDTTMATTINNKNLTTTITLKYLP